MVDSAANQDEDVTDAASDAARSMAADAMLALNLVPKKDTGSKKRDSRSHAGPDKIESIYVCTDAIRSILALVQNTSSYLDQVDDLSQIQLAKDCLVYAVDEIESQLNHISKAANNTKEKKCSQQAHAKFSREQRLIEKN